MEAALCLLTIVLPSILAGILIGGKMATATQRDSGDGPDKPPKPDESDARPAVSETRSRFPNDIALRKAGFAIAARPAEGQPVWVRNGLEYLESVAVRRMRGMADVRGE